MNKKLILAAITLLLSGCGVFKTTQTGGDTDATHQRAIENEGNAAMVRLVDVPQITVDMSNIISGLTEYFLPPLYDKSEEYAEKKLEGRPPLPFKSQEWQLSTEFRWNDSYYDLSFGKNRSQMQELKRSLFAILEADNKLQLTILFIVVYSERNSKIADTTHKNRAESIRAALVRELGLTADIAVALEVTSQAGTKPMAKVRAECQRVKTPAQQESYEALIRRYEKSADKLSIEDLYRLAEPLRPGSDQYREIYQTAALLYEDDAVSQLNAGASALVSGDAMQARFFLDRIKHDPRSVINRGLLALMEGDKQTAYEMFMQARTRSPRLAQECLNVWKSLQ